MAKPTPMLPDSPLVIEDEPSEAIAELTPTTWPWRFTNGPPELPGLIAASVCTALMNEESLPLPVVTGRCTALTMPEVTVAERPSGEPIATTVSPTRIWSADPKAAG